MIFIVAICSQTIFLIVSRMAGDSLIGVDLFDMSRNVLVDGGRGQIVAGAVTLGSHDGQQEEAGDVRSVVGDQDQQRTLGF